MPDVKAQMPTNKQGHVMVKHNLSVSKHIVEYVYFFFLLCPDIVKSRHTYPYFDVTVTNK